MREYVVAYVHRNWKREPRSPFARYTIVYSDPSAAHESAMALRAKGHASVTITPRDKVS